MRYARPFAILALIGILGAGTIGCISGTKTTETTDTKKVTSGSVKVGDIAPDFEMRNQDQLKISLSEFKGKKNVVLVFYPADFTPV